jgi:hypothetical protein
VLTTKAFGCGTFIALECDLVMETPQSVDGISRHFVALGVRLRRACRYRHQRGCQQFPSFRTTRQQWTRECMPIMTIQNRRKGPKKLVDLESDDCRWPLGEPRSPHFHFCGAKQLPGSPYCERHCRIAFYPPKRRIRPPLATPSRPAKAA